jgi:hypothetical protein
MPAGSWFGTSCDRAKGETVRRKTHRAGVIRLQARQESLARRKRIASEADAKAARICALLLVTNENLPFVMRASFHSDLARTVRRWTNAFPGLELRYRFASHLAVRISGDRPRLSLRFGAGACLIGSAEDCASG